MLLKLKDFHFIAWLYLTFHQFADSIHAIPIISASVLQYLDASPY